MTPPKACALTQAMEKNSVNRPSERTCPMTMTLVPPISAPRVISRRRLIRRLREESSGMLSAPHRAATDMATPMSPRSQPRAAARGSVKAFIM